MQPGLGIAHRDGRSETAPGVHCNVLNERFKSLAFIVCDLNRTPQRRTRAIGRVWTEVKFAGSTWRRSPDHEIMQLMR